jgi:hypothetical protein
LALVWWYGQVSTRPLITTGHLQPTAMDSPGSPSTAAVTKPSTAPIDLDAFFAEVEDEEVHFMPSLDIAELQQKEDAKHSALRKAAGKKSDGVINAHTFGDDDADTGANKAKEIDEPKPKRVFAKLDAERCVSYFTRHILW